MEPAKWPELRAAYNQLSPAGKALFSWKKDPNDIVQPNWPLEQKQKVYQNYLNALRTRLTFLSGAHAVIEDPEWLTPGHQIYDRPGIEEKQRYALLIRNYRMQKSQYDLYKAGRIGYVPKPVPPPLPRYIPPKQHSKEYIAFKKNAALFKMFLRDPDSSFARKVVRQRTRDAFDQMRLSSSFDAFKKRIERRAYLRRHPIDYSKIRHDPAPGSREFLINQAYRGMRRINTYYK